MTKLIKMFACGVVLVAGCAADGRGGTTASPTAATADVTHGLGGFDGACYNGYFPTDKICSSVDANAQGTTDNGNVIKVSVTATDQYLESSGDPVRIAVDVTLSDDGDYFDPEGAVPVVARAIVAGCHRGCSYSVQSQPVTLNRAEGQRKLTGHFEFMIHNGFGAEYTETVEKLEVLVPGVSGILTLTL